MCTTRIEATPACTTKHFVYHAHLVNCLPVHSLAAMSTSECLARVRRMRTLSALLDEDLDTDDQLSEDCRALFEHVTKATSTDLTHSSSSSQSTFLCVECQAHESELFCEQCHDYFCELCCGGQHRKGNRRKHTFQPCNLTPEDAAVAQDATTDVAMDATQDAVKGSVRKSAF